MWQKIGRAPGEVKIGGEEETLSFGWKSQSDYSCSPAGGLVT
jgi:hypothetical protein